MRLTHTRLLVTRFYDCLRFYRDVLGLTVAWGQEGGRYADLHGGSGSGSGSYAGAVRSGKHGTGRRAR